MARINDQSILAFETSHCHNIVLQVLLEGGIPALLLFGGFLVFLGRKAFRLCTGRNKPVWLVLLPCLILSILAGEMAECHTLFVFTYSPVPFALFLAAGFIAASDTAGESENRRVKFRSCLVFPAICAAVMCIAALFVLNSSVPVVNQADYDDPAADLFYSCGDENCETHGGSHTIYTSGCGLCAVSNAVRYMTGQGIDVRELAAFARENEQYVVHLGSKGTMTESVAEAFGEEYGFAYLGKAGSLAEATDYIKMGCTVIAGVGNSSGGGHLLVIADYDPLTKQYLILDSAGSSDSWSRSFSSWQRIRGDCLTSNPDVTFTSFRILGPSRLESYID